MSRSLDGSQERQELKVTPPQLASQWGISPDKVHAWIRAGELKAIGMSTTRGGRPRYLIDAKDIESFEKRRAVVPPVAKVPKRKPPIPKVLYCACYSAKVMQAVEATTTDTTRKKPCLIPMTRSATRIR